jgi:type II secretory pathway predicted ATPase ExeA
LISSDNPTFPFHVCARRYFPAAAIEDARLRIIRNITRRNGPALVIGGAGCGKSLLLEVLAEHFRPELQVVHLACGGQLGTCRALLQAMLFELGLAFQGQDEGELRLRLLQHLHSSEYCQGGVLLLVDDAQNLPLRVLMELQSLSSLVQNGSPLMSIVLFGPPVLEESFPRPQLESFHQRISARAYLTPLGKEETAQFIRAQIAASGANSETIFQHDALVAVYSATDGVPRLVNYLCSRALELAFDNGDAMIDRLQVDAAWCDIQQLPGSGRVSEQAINPIHAGERAIEFGSLGEIESPPQIAESGPPLRSGRDAGKSPGSVVANQRFEPFQPSDLLSWVAPVEYTRSEEQIARPENPPRPADSDHDFHSAPARFHGDHGGEIPISSTRQDSCQTSQALQRSRIAARDQCDESFYEEEVVLDRIAALGDAFHERSPRVQNVRDEQFSRMIDAALKAPSRLDESRSTPNAPAGPPPSVGFSSKSAIDVTASDVQGLDFHRAARPLELSDDNSVDGIIMDEPDSEILLVEDDSFEVEQRTSYGVRSNESWSAGFE